MSGLLFLIQLKKCQLVYFLMKCKQMHCIPGSNGIGHAGEADKISSVREMCYELFYIPEQKVQLESS